MWNCSVDLLYRKDRDFWTWNCVSSSDTGPKESSCHNELSITSRHSAILVCLRSVADRSVFWGFWPLVGVSCLRILTSLCSVRAKDWSWRLRSGVEVETSFWFSEVLISELGFWSRKLDFITAVQGGWRPVTPLLRAETGPALPADEINEIEASSSSESETISSDSSGSSVQLPHGRKHAELKLIALMKWLVHFTGTHGMWCYPVPPDVTRSWFTQLVVVILTGHRSQLSRSCNSREIKRCQAIQDAVKGGPLCESSIDWVSPCACAWKKPVWAASQYASISSWSADVDFTRFAWVLDCSQIQLLSVTQLVQLRLHCMTTVLSLLEVDPVSCISLEGWFLSGISDNIWDQRLILRLNALSSRAGAAQLVRWEFDLTRFRWQEISLSQLLQCVLNISMFNPSWYASLSVW